MKKVRPKRSDVKALKFTQTAAKTDMIAVETAKRKAQINPKA